MAGMGPGIVIKIGAEVKDAIDGIDSVNKRLGDKMSGFDKFSSGVNKAFVPALAALGGLGVAAVDFAKAAAEDAKQADLLALALKNTTGATKNQVASVEDWISAQGRQLGFADDQLRPALGVLVRATNDVAQAQSLAASAMDVATATGKPLESVTVALAKAAAGQTTALAKLVPGMDKAILESKDMTKIQAEMARIMGGSAATAANTAAGRMQRMSLAIDEAKEGIGAALLPVIERLVPYLQKMAEWAQDNADVLFKVGVVIAGVAGSVVVLKGALAAWTAIQWALNSALLANPITWVVVAIVALVAAVVVAYHRFEWFKNIVDFVWEGIQVAIGAVVKWFQETAWPIIKKVVDFIANYFKFLFGIYKTVWDGIWAAAEFFVTWFQNTAWPAIKAVVDSLVTVFNVLKDAIGTAWNWIAEKITAVWDVIRPILQAMWDKIQGVIDLAKGVGNAVGNVVGAITPWGAAAPAALAAPGLRTVGPQLLTGGYRNTGGQSVNVIVNQTVGDPVAAAKEIRRILNSGSLRSGVVI